MRDSVPRPQEGEIVNREDKNPTPPRAFENSAASKLPVEVGAEESTPSTGEAIEAQSLALRPLVLFAAVPAISVLGALGSLALSGYLSFESLVANGSIWILGAAASVFAVSVAVGLETEARKPELLEVVGFSVLLLGGSAWLLTSGALGLAGILFVCALGAFWDLGWRRRHWDRPALPEASPEPSREGESKSP